MAKIVLPGKKEMTVEGPMTLGQLKQQGVVPATYHVARKDSTGTLRQMTDSDPVAGEDIVFAIPHHVQGAR